MTDFAQARRHMVDCQLRPFDIVDRPLLGAFDAVARELFLPDEARAVAYLDRQVDVGAGRRLLTPMTLARLIQALELQPTDRVVDLACGLGYSTAVMAPLCENVVGIESDAALADAASARLAAAGVSNAAAICAALDAAPPGGPLDAMLVNGAVAVVPDAWRGALKEGGRVAMVRSGSPGRAVLLTRHRGVFAERILFDASAPSLPDFAPKPQFAF